MTISGGKKHGIELERCPFDRARRDLLGKLVDILGKYFWANRDRFLCRYIGIRAGSGHFRGKEA